MQAQARSNTRFAPRRHFSEMRTRIALRTLSEHEIGRPHGRMRLKNIVQGQLDARVQPLYDFFSVAVNTATRAETLFTTPFGQQYTGAGGSAIIKTLWHSNLLTSGALDAPKKLLVKNISLVGRPDMSIADVNALVGQYLVSFSTLGKQFWVGHGQKLPAGGGAFASGGATFTAPQAQFSAANGWPSAQNVAPITDGIPDIPGYPPITPITGVLLEQQQPFQVICDPTLTAGTVYTTANSTTTIPGYVSVGVFAWIYLEGITLVAVV
jgi:hypothetical protein